MELTPKQQTIELIRQAQRLLLITRPGMDGDALGSLVGLGGVLAKLGKEVALLSPDPVPANLSFLPLLDRVQHQFTGARDLKVSLDLTKAAVEKVSYRKSEEEKTLDILITPKSGIIPEQAVSVAQSSFRFDAIVILDTPDLEQLAAMYDEHTKLFFEVPIVNIDHHAGNDYFGKINWVDLTATSTAEILVSLTEALGGGQSLWDADVATALLAGLIWDTQSFQSENTTPKSLTVAAQLIALGARQQDIVRSLFKTKPLSTLRLWGTVLSGLQVDDDHGFVWAEVTAAELASTGAKPHEIGGLMDELIKNATGKDLVVIIMEETPGTIAVLLHALQKQVDLPELARRLGGNGGTHRILVTLHEPREAARERVLRTIRQFQRRAVGI
jgi:phosphoesterase RecJ-like protein